MSEATIFVRFTVAGFHRWDGAAVHRSYLADPHRHLFNVEVRMQVTHDDREVEFHDLLDEARAMFESLADEEDDFGSRSCEMLGRELGSDLVEHYHRPVTVIVSEDSECGAQVDIAPAAA